MFNRIIKFSPNNSFFLFGARGTGKSFLLRERYSISNSVTIDLLDPDTFLQYSLNPGSLSNYIATLDDKIEWIIIDEVQKIPSLLDVVHKFLSDGNDKKFILTGSSARKLKRGGGNMLAGRAFVYDLFPLTHIELAKKFDLMEVLKFGSLPGIYNFTSEDDKNEFLRSYHYTYITQEITEEQVVRKLDLFRRFLNIAAQMNGKVLNYSKVARESGISTPTVITYFQILEDTLLGMILPAYHGSIRKSQRESPKFYFFDTGVLNALKNTLTLSLNTSTYNFGELFESFIINEINRLQIYYRKDWKFSFLRTASDNEIDLIIERPGMKTALIEIKSTENLFEQQVSVLNNFTKDFPNSEAFCFSLDKISKKYGNVNCLHWKSGIEKLFD